ncbi:hypothetical protein LDENG_00171120 [Lucifuga dentata]|nr:hypothetical protein LDENG_00171120 [Lucifuga dentata]
MDFIHVVETGAHTVSSLAARGAPGSWSPAGCSGPFCAPCALCSTANTTLRRIIDMAGPDLRNTAAVASAWVKGQLVSRTELWVYGLRN